MKVGISGTRHGLNDKQFKEISEFLSTHFTPGSELHHGDCVGVDVEVAGIALALGYKIVCHPPVNNSLRANFPSDEYRVAQTYFARNRNIVDETDLLMAAPHQNQWQPRGGTWYTHDYAKSKRKPLKLFLPEPEGLEGLE